MTIEELDALIIEGEMKFQARLLELQALALLLDDYVYELNTLCEQSDTQIMHKRGHFTDTLRTKFNPAKPTDAPRIAPARNEFTFIRRTGGNGYYVWSEVDKAYVEEVDNGTTILLG